MRPSEGRALVSASRPPLRDERAEDALVGWLVLEPALIWKMGIRRELFTNEWHWSAYTAIRELSIEGATVNLITVADKLARLEGGGSNTPHFLRLEELAHSRSVGGPVELARVLRDYYRRRELERLGGLAVRMARALDEDVAEMAARVAGEIVALGAEGELDLVSLPDVVDATAKELLTRAPGTIDGVPTGFERIDAVLGGMPFGEMTILAGRPSQGKSALAQQIAERNAADGEVLYCSPEMSNKQLAYRTISRLAGIRLHSIRFAELSEQQRDEMGRIATATAPVILFDKGRMTTDDIASAARKVKAQAKPARPLRLVVVDHVQYLAPMRKVWDPVQEIGERSAACKQLGRELGVPMLVLSQLSRETGKRKDPTPIMSDLKGSGDLEQDADVILAVHRPGLYSGKVEDAGRAEVHVLKNRNGPPGLVSIGWNGLLAKFLDEIA